MAYLNILLVERWVWVNGGKKIRTENWPAFPNAGRGWMKSKVYKRWVNTRDESLARILNAATRIRTGDDQLIRIIRWSTHTNHTRFSHASCKMQWGWGWDLWRFIVKCSGPGSVVGIATAYGLDGPGIESWWGRDFPHLSRSSLRPTHPPVQ
jgi:hypothetical protein